MEKFRRECPECGGRMVFEKFRQYSRISYINKDGSISKRFRTEDGGTMEVFHFYCEDCGWSPYEGREY